MSWVLPHSPVDYEIPFRAVLTSDLSASWSFDLSRSPWSRAALATAWVWLRELRSLDPPASPCARPRVAPDPRSILSWVFHPSEAFSACASSPSWPAEPPSRARAAHRSPEGLPITIASRRLARHASPLW